jgi:hypothetical protein
MAEDGGPWTLWLHNVTHTAAQFSGQIGHAYTFYSVAYDHTGQVEATPPSADAATTVVAPLVLNATLSEGNLEIRFPTAAGRLYQLESRQSLSAGSWVAVPGQDRVVGTGGTVLISQQASEVDGQFYRVVSLP